MRLCTATETKPTTFLERAAASGMPQKVNELFNKEVEKLRRFNPSSPDYSVLYSYLDTLVTLPWNKYTTSSATLKSASEVLEADHYGLEKVKDRIVEQLAMLLHNPEGNSPIICLVGLQVLARLRLANRWPEHWDANTSVYLSAVCMTKPRYAVTDALTSEPCPAVSSTP